MTYQEAISLLEGASKRKKLSPIYLRLERLKLLFAELNLDLTMPAVHIAGTSGKGSTSSICAAILQEAGYTVGLHTTPHLQTPRERMQINGQMPTEAEFTSLVQEVYSAAIIIEERHSYGAFRTQELIFTVAALHFKKSNIDVAVIETFMGGQYDPTNIIQPLVSVITNVDLDHTRLLGKTLESITMIKSGVIKPHTPFITAATQPHVLQLLRQRCQDMDAPCVVVGHENKYKSRMLGQKGSLLSVQVLNQLFANLHVGLLGRYQIDNAILVLYIIQVLRARGWLVSDDAIRAALAKAFIPGRLEIVQQEPLVVLDGAHNPAKSKALATSLKKIFRNRKAIFVFAMKKGKDLPDSVKPLLPLAEKFIITRFSAKKSRSTAEVARYIKSCGVPTVTRLDPSAALALAQRQVKGDQYVCVTGSLYLVGKIRNHWHPFDPDIDHVTIEDTGWPTSVVGEPVSQSELKGGRHDR